MGKYSQYRSKELPETTEQPARPVMQHPTGKYSQYKQPTTGPETGEIISAGGKRTKERGWGEAIGEAFSNVPISAYNMAKGMYEAVRHPKQTATAIGQTAVGGMESFKPDDPSSIQDSPDPISLLIQPTHPETAPYFKALEDHYKQRYGSIKGFKNAIAEDPVGVLVDATSALTGVGGMTRAVGTSLTKSATTGAARVGTALQKAGEFVQKGGAAIEPVTLGKNVTMGWASKFVQKKLPKKASDMYQSAAKFVGDLSPDELEKLSNTALDYKIMPSPKGMATLEKNITSLNDKITKMIDVSASKGEKIPLKRLFRDFRKLERDAVFSGKPLDSQRAIREIRKQIYKANNQIGRKQFTPVEAQKLKTRIYRETESYFKKVNDSPASIRAQHAVARAAKEAIEKLIPEIKQLNANEGALLDLKKVLRKSSKRISNRDLSGIGVPIKSTAGANVGKAVGDLLGMNLEPLGVAGGIALALMDTPLIKAKLAIVLNTLKKRGIVIDQKNAATRALLAEIYESTKEPIAVEKERKRKNE